MRIISQKELSIALEKHVKWLRGEPGGERANLRGADLCGAKIDYASWPLWCGSLRVHIDDRQARQLLYHVLSAVSYSDNCSAEIKAALLSMTNIAIANKFHRVGECGELDVHTVTDADGQ